MFFNNTPTKEQALQKIKQYCNYQERSHREVRDKLYSYGLGKKQVEDIIASLIEGNFVNEERFAIQFAGGKFRMKQWGRKKIQYELQQKGVNSFIIKVSLKKIDDQTYFETLHKLAQIKWEALTDKNDFVRQSKTTAYLLQKGYERELITKVLNNLSTREP